MVVEDAAAVEDKLVEEAVGAVGAVEEEEKQEQSAYTTMTIIVTRMGMIFILNILERRATHRVRIIRSQQPSRITWADPSVIAISLYDRDHRIMIEITT